MAASPADHRIVKTPSLRCQIKECGNAELRNEKRAIRQCFAESPRELGIISRYRNCPGLRRRDVVGISGDNVVDDFDLEKLADSDVSAEETASWQRSRSQIVTVN